MGERRGASGLWWGMVRERDHLGKADVDGRIILRWILSKQDVGSWTALIWLRRGRVGGHL